MDREKMEQVKDLLKRLKLSETSNALMKRSAMIAVVLGFIQSNAAVGRDADVDKLAKALEPADTQQHGTHPWADWKDWKDWNDWSDWSDWNNWRDWSNWNNWKDWNDWRDWKNWGKISIGPLK